MSDLLKYALTDLSVLDDDKGITFYRIVALNNLETSLGTVKKGELGGFVSSEYNLSQEGNCWIYAHGKASGQSKVLEDAIITDFSLIQDDAEISGKAILKNYAIARERCIITGECEIRGHGIVEGNVYLGGKFIVSDTACLSGDVRTKGKGSILNKAYIYGRAFLSGNIHISKSVVIGGNASICGNIKITDNVIIKEHAEIEGSCVLNGNCKIFGYSIIDYDIGGNTVLNVSLESKRKVISSLKIFDPLLIEEKNEIENKTQISKILRNLNKKKPIEDTEQ